MKTTIASLTALMTLLTACGHDTQTNSTTSSSTSSEASSSSSSVSSVSSVSSSSSQASSSTVPSRFIACEPPINSTPNENNLAPQIQVNIETHNQTIFVDASATSDPDGDDLHFEIDFGDGPTSIYRNDHIIPHSQAWHQYQRPGEYAITVSAFDGRLESKSTEMVTISTNQATENQAPIAFAYVSPSNEANGAEYSIDPDGDTITYQWTVLDGCNPLTAEGETLLVDGPDAYHLLLTVDDGDLGDTKSLLVYKSGSYWDNHPKIDFYFKSEGLTLTADGRATDNAHNLTWLLDGEVIGTGVTLTHTVDQPGLYELSLKGSRIFSDTKKVIIKLGEGNTAPQPTFSCTTPSASAPLRVSCEFASLIDAEGDYLVMDIDFGDGTKIKRTHPSNTAGRQELFDHTYEQAGSYTISVTAEDAELQGSHSFTIDLQ